MADSLSIDFKGSDVFQGSNLIIIATYIGDSSHKVLKKSNITLENNPPNENISIKTYEDTNRKTNIDDTNNKMIVPFIIEIKNSEDTSDINLKFSTTITGSSVKNSTYKQHSSVDGSIDISSLEPLVIGSTVVNDLSPIKYPQNPDKNHPKLNIVIYPRTSTNKSLPYCQIPLYVDGIQYTRLYNNTTEIFPFNNNMYYVNTDSSGNLDINFYAQSLTDTYAAEVIISNTMYDSNFSSQKNALFLTKNIIPSDKLDHPSISNISGNEVPPPLNNNDSFFEVTLPQSAPLNILDTIYIMSDVDIKTPIVCISDMYAANKKFNIPYKPFIPFQLNTLYYYVFTAGQDIFKSKNLIFRVGGDSNTYVPPKGNLRIPTINNYSGKPVDQLFTFGIGNLGTGITCVIPVGIRNSPQLNDMVTCTVTIITYDPDGNLKPLVIPIGNSQQVKNTTPITFSIGKSVLTGFGVDSAGHATPFYVNYLVNQQKNSQSWEGYLDTVEL